MMKPRPAVLFLSVLMWLLSVPRAGAAPPDAPRCDKPRAEEAFTEGFDHYSRKRWAAAIPGLEEAANLCPRPDGPWLISLHGFGEAPYIPYFYLGRCHAELKDHPAALRQFYLSICFEEPARGKSRTENLGSMTDACLKQIRSPQRPQKHPFFSEGFTAYVQEKWEKAAERMWDSLQNWPEDGKTTYSNGRWPEAYLPRFQLAKALDKLGCPRQACELLERSLVNDLVARGNPRVKAESKEVAELRAACADRSRRAQTDTSACQRWDCWLRQESR